MLAGGTGIKPQTRLGRKCGVGESLTLSWASSAQPMGPVSCRDGSECARLITRSKFDMAFDWWYWAAGDDNRV
jgi:hypothetical protein